MVQVSGAATAGANLWRPVFNAHLIDIRAGVNIGGNLRAAKEIAESVPGFDASEIRDVEKDCKPAQRFNELRRAIENGDLSFVDQARELQRQYGFDEADLNRAIFSHVRGMINGGNLSFIDQARELQKQYGFSEVALDELIFNQLKRKIEAGDLSFVDQARELQRQHDFDEADLTQSIFHGANERLLTLQLYIGAGNLSYIDEARKLIQDHGDVERFAGERKRSELLINAIDRGVEVAIVKREIAAREAEAAAMKALLDIGADI